MEKTHKQEMGSISTTNYLNELIKTLGHERRRVSLDGSYLLLHEYCKKKVVPKILEKDVTIATVETTTCGLLSDLLTGVSGASRYFIMGMVPYSQHSKIELGVDEKLLSHEGPGTVSMETAIALSKRVREFSKAKVGIAETGLLLSEELLKKKTKKKSGLVFLSISTQNNSWEKKLDIQTTSSRIFMRHDIAYHILSELVSFFDSS
ncbi:MAG: CinA family protein [Candidatus Hodarchaeales archaeon]